MKLTAKEFGNRVRQWRVSQRLTQWDFARELGISQSLVSCIENGYFPVEKDIVIKVLNKVAGKDVKIVKVESFLFRRDGLWFGLFLEDTTNDGLQSDSQG